MITVRDIDNLFNKIVPQNISESWDNDGVMFCESLDKEVKKVLVALDATLDVIEYARENGFDVIVTHHPFIFKKLSRITGADYKKQNLLMDANISVLSYHTRLDSAKEGVNDVLCETIALKNVTSFGGERGDCARVGVLDKEMSPEEFAHYLKQKLSCDIKCAYGNKNKIKKVAVLGGSGKDFFFDAKSVGADAFVTSEIPHNLFLEANETDFALYDCGHYYTERVVCEKIKQSLQNEFSDLFVKVKDIGCPYKNF